MRVLFGLEGLPRGLPPDDPRLPGVTLGPSPLRLNTAPLPPAILAGAPEGHTARLDAMRAWMQAQCGDYAVKRRRFIAVYLDFVADAIARRHAALRAGLAQYDGLYAAEDWTWSALRPLPRAWIPAPEGLLQADVAFWDGTRLIVAVPETARTGWDAAGITAIPLLATATAEALPASFHGFWEQEPLPRSPFRRPPLARPTQGGVVPAA